MKSSNFIVCLLVATGFERWFSDDKLVGQYTKTPDIDTVVIVSATATRQHLRWEVVEGTAHGLSTI